MSWKMNKATWWLRQTLWKYGLEISSYPNVIALLNECGLFIDAGASYGDTRDWVRSLGYQGEVMSFEPITPLWQRMMNRHQDDKLWIRENKCLSDQDGKATFFQDLSMSEASGLLSKDAASSKAYEVNTYRLESLLPKNDTRRIFLKTDCEGHDIGVVKGAGSALSRIDYVLMEVGTRPRYPEEPDFTAVIVEMDKLGFRVACNLGNLYTDNNRRAHSLDLIFERKDTKK
jgi:FkbM family methyltransferase